MKSLYRQYLFAPVLCLVGLGTLVMFQNCSKDVGFKNSESDNRGPDIIGQDVTVRGNSDVVIRFIDVPKDSDADVAREIAYEVITPDSSVESITCELNNSPIDCEAADRVTIPPTGVGSQNFTITVTTADGTTVTEAIDWIVHNQIIERTKTFSVTAVGDKVDIIINIDNSGSMQYEQESMAQRINNFMAPFAGLDYHIAITTTSPVGNSEIWKPSLDYVDGKFVSLDSSGTRCIKSTTHSLSQAQQLVAANVVRGEFLLNDIGEILVVDGATYPEGNGFERGIFTTYRAFERHFSSTQTDGSCLRDGSVPKHVILISDEDETLFVEDRNNNVVGGALPDQHKSSGSELVSYILGQLGSNTEFRFHSIIVNPNSAEGQSCLASHGRIVGTDYAKLSNDTGGFIGSVCAPDYSSQLDSIGRLISDTRSSETLGCAAVANAAGSFGIVKDLSTGQELGISYEFNGSKVDFAETLDIGNYEVTYYCYN